MKHNGKKIILIFLVFALLWLNFTSARAEDDISDVQDSIEKVNNKIEKVQAQLNQSQKAYNNNQAQINKTQGLISLTEQEISRKENEIENLNNKIELNKKLLMAYLREISFTTSAEQALSFTASQSYLSDFSANVDGMMSVKDKILSVTEEIKSDKENLSETKEELADEKEDHEKLLTIKQMQQAEVKAEIQSAQTTLSQLNSKLSQLRTRYTQLLGHSVSTKDIMEAAKFAAKATNMNRSFLLAVLIQESNKGQNTGSCDYRESRMTSTQLTAFKDICGRLDYNYKKMNVSCPPKNYKGTGGAMGVPQFMPTTWRAYEKDIASFTGHDTPDPWNLVDGVTAMAIKLSRDGASKKTRFAEAKSYCIYLAGGNWGYYCFGTDKYKDDYEDVNCWGSSIRNYGEKVLCLKDNYEKYY